MPKKHTSPRKKSGNQTFPIVALGASAGGLEAFEAFFNAASSDTGMAFVLIAHLDPSHVSLLPELLQKRTTMPVHQISDGLSVQPNHVYVIPPNKDLAILHGTFQLMDLPLTRTANMRIDSFFCSLANDQGASAIGVILSGTGTDGTLGVRAIKAQLGMVMVQDGASAKYDGMPLNAMATELADYVLPPEKMPEQLSKYTQHASLHSIPRITPHEGEIPNALQKIYIALRAQTDHDFSLYKNNTINRRIERRMAVHQIDSIDDYARYLQESVREVKILFKELLIGVTRFFRDAPAFEALSEKLLPQLLQGKPDNYTIRVWVAGCSSGEEAYSLAIVLQECMERMKRHFNVQIFGTDLDEDAINIARTGLYSESILVDVSPERLQRYFAKEDDGRYQIKKSIREMLVFAPQNLIKDPPFTKLDILSCRNLLIYLGPQLQKKLFPVFHYSLKADGLLFLGSSETVGQHTDLFAVQEKKCKIFRRQASEKQTHPALAFQTTSLPYEPLHQEVPEKIRKAEEVSALQLVETILQQSNTPPCAIIDDACNVIYIHGRTGHFLEPAEGKISVNILEMARMGLKSVLSNAINRVATNKQEFNQRGLRIENDGDALYLNLSVKPIIELGLMRGLMMVVFEQLNGPTVAGSTPQPVVRINGPKRKSIEALTQELVYMKENLQTTIEELETSNEELKSTNEELQSTNEELQSTNEEMETSKEELQSLNEESVTVNAELQSRIDDLSEANDDMKNFLDSTDIATLFLDSELRVRRFTPTATKIVPLAVTDSGRPVKHFATSLMDVSLEACGQEVLKDLVIRIKEVKSHDGFTYLMKVRPYRTTSNMIDGVVITFDDITERKRAECRRLQVENQFQTYSELGLIGMAMTSLEKNWIHVNDRLCEILGYTREQLSQLTWAEVTHDDDLQADEAEFQRVLAGEINTYSLDKRFIRNDGKVVYASIAVKCIRDEKGGISHFAAFVQDISERIEAQQATAESALRYRTLFELTSDSIMLVNATTCEIEEFNHAAYEGLGYSREEFGQLKPRDIESVGTTDGMSGHIKVILKQGSDSFETQHTTKEGRVLRRQVKAKMVVIKGEQLLLFTFRDI